MATAHHVQTAQELELTANADPDGGAQALTEAAEYWPLAGIDDRLRSR